MRISDWSSDVCSSDLHCAAAAAQSRSTPNERIARMRLPVLLAIVVTASACGGVEYRDSNATVVANPLCASAPNRPGEPVSKDCERASEATGSNESRDQGEPLHFSGKKDERTPKTEARRAGNAVVR